MALMISLSTLSVAGRGVAFAKRKNSYTFLKHLLVSCRELALMKHHHKTGEMHGLDNRMIGYCSQSDEWKRKERLCHKRLGTNCLLTSLIMLTASSVISWSLQTHTGSVCFYKCRPFHKACCPLCSLMEVTSKEEDMAKVCFFLTILCFSMLEVELTEMDFTLEDQT